MSVLAILRAVLTVGKQRFQFGPLINCRKLLHRFGVGLSLLSFLEQQNDKLCLNRDFQILDGSEKAQLSYWYGMVLAKIIAEKKLDVPWLVHVDEMLSNGVLTTTPGIRERRDLVGLGKNGDWHVVEAKGRSNKYNNDLIAKAKQQSARVVQINGQVPATNSACITSLFPKPISVLLDDPPADVGQYGEEWEISQEDFLGSYYKEIIEYLRSFKTRERRFGNANFVTAPLVFFSPFLTRIEIGLIDTIHKAPEQAGKSESELMENEEGCVGSDGIAVFGALPKWEFPMNWNYI